MSSPDNEDVRLVLDSYTPSATVEGDERTFSTPHGNVKAVIRGDPSIQPTIVTYHDIGLTYTNCFGGFFGLAEVSKLISRFAIVHMIAPGNEPDARDLEAESYPDSLETLVSQLASVLSQLAVHHTIGFGLGAGATILLNYALEHPGTMVGLVLVGTSASPPSVASWAYHKAAQYFAGQRWTPPGLISRHFSSSTQESNKEMIEMYSRDLERLNFHNMMLFSNAYMKRPDLLELVRAYRSPMLLVCGREDSYHDDMVNLYDAANPEVAELVEVSCGHLVMEEAPHKLVRPLELFLYSCGL